MYKRYLVVFIFSFIFISCDLTTEEENLHISFQYAENQDYKKAIKELDKAIRKRRKYRRALFNRAVYKTEVEDFSGAIEDYKSILDFAKCPSCVFNLAVLLKNDEQYEKAIELFSYTLKTEGLIKGTDIVFNSSYFENDSNREYYVKESDVLILRGLAYLKINQFNDAISDFKKMIKKDYYINDAYFFIGNAYLGLNDTINACKNYKMSAILNYEEAKKKVKEVCK